MVLQCYYITSNTVVLHLTMVLHFDHLPQSGNHQSDLFFYQFGGLGLVVVLICKKHHAVVLFQYLTCLTQNQALKGFNPDRCEVMSRRGPDLHFPDG